MSVAIVLPTLNEEKGVGKMIDGIRKMAKPDWKIYVVDSGSTDATVRVAREKGAELIELAERGKGIAIRKAFAEIGDDQLVLIDADMSYLAEDIPSIIRQLDNYDVVLGSRFKGNVESGAMSGTNSFGNRVLTAFGNALFSRNASDICTGMWGFTKKAYRSMKIDAPHFELEANFFSEAAKRGFAIQEVPISYGKREGVSKLRIADGFKIALYLLKSRVAKK